MNPARLINRPATLIRRTAGGEDAAGNPVHNTEEVDILCELQQRRRSEDIRAVADLSDTLWDLFLPGDTVVGTGDAVRVDGYEYELVGEPWEVPDPSRGVVSHIEATVRRTAGPDDEEEEGS